MQILAARKYPTPRNGPLSIAETETRRLAYPLAHASQAVTERPYAQSSSLPAGYTHTCAALYIDLFDANLRLRRDIGNELIQKAILSPG